MSGKRAKKLRSIQKEMANQLRYNVNIKVYGDGRIEVSGFPVNFMAAMNIMNSGVVKVS